MTKKKKSIRNFGGKKNNFLRKSLLFFRKSAIFSRNFPKTYRNLTLGFLGFFYWPILGFQFFLSGNTGQYCCRPMLQDYENVDPAVKDCRRNKMLSHAFENETVLACFLYSDMH